MKRLLSLITVSALLLNCLIFASANTSDENIKIVSDNTAFAIETAEMINEAENSASMLRIIGKTRNPNFDFEKFVSADAVVSEDGRFVLQFKSENELLACLKELESDPEIIYAERDVPIFTAALEESTENLSWGVSAIEADIYSESILDFVDGNTATVAIIDSGCKDVDFIKEKLVAGYDFIDNDTDATNDTSDDSHGTFLASIVTDCTKILPVKIMPVRVLSSKTGSLINAVNGIYYAVDNGADVINISLGGKLKDCSSLDDAVAYATDNSVSVVVCAGNARSDIETYCPAHIKSAVTVSSVNEENSFSARFSNFGSSIDIAAPGEDIVGYNALGEKVVLSGTSMSAAFVSAAAAICKLANPGFTPEQIQTSLTNAAEDFGDPGWDKYYGYGVLRLSKMPIPEKTYTVEWTVDGSAVSETYKKGESIILPEVPEKYGYIFGGWTPEVPVTMPDENLTFNGSWIPVECELVFDAATGTFADGTAKISEKIRFDAEITAPEPPSKPGYIFMGWSADGLNPVNDFGRIDNTDGKKFTALWAPATDTLYTVETYTMNTEGEYIRTDQSFTGKTDSVANAEYDIKNGFTLNKEKSILSGVITADNSLVLKVYIDRNVYKFTTVVDGVPTETEYLYESIIAEPCVPSKTGYSFVGWDNSVPEKMPANDITVTAVFDANIYDAVFNANGGKWSDGATTKTVPTDFDSKIETAANPEKQGYDFSGWDSEIGSMDDVNGKTFNAKWSARNDTEYTVETHTMDVNGKYSVTSETKQGTTDTVASVTAKAPTGFTFNSAKSNLSGNIAADGSLVLSVYLDRNTYEFTTVVDGKSTSKTYYFDAPITKPQIPAKAGYSFVGWDNAVPPKMPANDVTVTAKSECISTVEIKNNLGSKTLNYGETLILTAAVTDRPDDATVVWYVDGVKSSEGETFSLTFESGTRTVEVKLVDKNGEALKNSNGEEIADFQEVTVKSGFLQKLISFFKNLFRLNRVITQTIKF